MSADEYAWTDEQARKFTAPCVDRWQWDAWLAAHDARVRRDAKAEGWDEAYWQGVQDEIDSQGFDGGMTGPNRINPYRETGDQR